MGLHRICLYLQRETEERYSEDEAEVADGSSGHGEMHQLRQRREELTQKHFDQERRRQVSYKLIPVNSLLLISNKGLVD